jgi:hypothetical protein
MPQTAETKQDDPHGMKRADDEIARAYERIKSADEDIARLDAALSKLERSDKPPARPRQEGAGAERSDATVAATPTSEKPMSESEARHSGLKGNRAMLGGLVGLLLAICIFAGAFASRYGNEAKAIVSRWTSQVSIAPRAASELAGPKRSPIVQVADADGQPSPPAPSSHKEAEGVPSSGAPMSTDLPSTDLSSTDLAQSLKTIAHDLASINEKLEQLKSSHEQTLRDHAEAIQQLKAAQEYAARDNARAAEQVQALQTQLAVVSAKSSGRSVVRVRETTAAARPRLSAAASHRPKRSRAPWMGPPDIGEPWFDPDW